MHDSTVDIIPIRELDEDEDEGDGDGDGRELSSN